LRRCRHRLGRRGGAGQDQRRALTELRQDQGAFFFGLGKEGAAAAGRAFGEDEERPGFIGQTEQASDVLAQILDQCGIRNNGHL